MTQANIENETVAVDFLSEGDSVTVPSGEVWKGHLTLHGGPTMRINGDRFMTKSDTHREVVLKGGDTVKMSYQETNEHAWFRGIKL